MNTKGRASPLAREDYLALQDFLAHRIFIAAGQRKLAVHIHSSIGVPPFLRTIEADVRNLDSVLTDVRYFDTQFVLIHGGTPLVEYAAYLFLKPHAWYDMSAMTFLYSIPDLADVLRKVLTFAPEKLLFSTDVGSYPNIPVGADLHHVAISRRLVRESWIWRRRSGWAKTRCEATPSGCMGGRHGRSAAEAPRR